MSVMPSDFVIVLWYSGAGSCAIATFESFTHVDPIFMIVVFFVIVVYHDRRVIVIVVLQLD